MCKKRSYLIYLLFLISNIIYSQNGEYFSVNYLPKEYGAAANNFGITQGDDGLIFVANVNGVLIFNGVKWSSYLRSKEDQVTITTINKTNNGKIVYGCIDGDFGELEKKDNGKFYLHSLKSNLPDAEQPAEAIRQIINLNGSIYFLSSDKLVEYGNSKFRVYKPGGSFHTRAMVMGNHLFVFDKDNSISVLQNGVLSPVLNSENFSNFKTFYCFPLTKTEFAFGVRGEGTYKAVYDSITPTRTKFIPFPSQCDNELQTAEFNNGTALKNGNFIITTNKKGAFVINKQLQIIQRFNTKNGLNDDNVKAAFEDENGNLWFSLYYGISYIETNSKLFKYTRNNGIKGPVQSATYFQDQLYIATDKGIQYYDELQQSFKDLPDFDKQSWYLLNYLNKLFICSQNGIYIYNGKTIQQISSKKTNLIMNDPIQKNVLYAAIDNGLEIYDLSGENLILIKAYNLNHEVKSIASDSNKNIYFGTADNGIYFFNYKKSLALDSLQEKEGLPSQVSENYLTTYKNKLIIGTDSGIYTVAVDQKLNYKCIKDPDFWKLTKGTEIYKVAELGGDLICSQSFENKLKDKVEQKIIYILKNGTTYSLNNNAITHLKDIKANLITYDSIKKVVFICTDEGLFLMNKQNILSEKKYNLYLSSFYAKNDTVFQNLEADDKQLQNEVYIKYKNNDIKINVAYNCFENINNIEFAYYLEGKEEGYSKRERKFEFNFNNLSEGSYVFHLKAFNEITNNVLELHIPFKILPPWYRTIWAYIVYAIIFIAFLILILKLNSKRLIAQNLKLEDVIKQRTSTINEQVILLEHKNKEITDSINYARRIQRALLASKKMLDANLISKNNKSDYFIFFQPKDIVSGDFYWASKLSSSSSANAKSADSDFAIAIADSTGHGVPGAIMSMLNISCLKEAVVAQKLAQPGQILNYTRTKIIETLANDGSTDGGKDGMDCSLLCFDFKTNTLTYSAANNPIWIVRPMAAESSKEIIELKADKMPVGKHDRDTVSFTQQTIQLQKGDVLYASTDGMPDQFGGPKGKKFMYKQLKELLLEISDLPLNEQQDIITEKFHSWKGNLEQVDDVLVFGFRII